MPGYPLPPFIFQNLENTGFILRLYARSLSLKKLHAKSREHESYSELRWRSMARFGTRRRAGPSLDSRGSGWIGVVPGNAPHHLVQLSKTSYYLVGNLLRLMLSIVRLDVKKKQGQALRIKRRYVPSVGGFHTLRTSPLKPKDGLNGPPRPCLRRLIDVSARSY